MKTHNRHLNAVNPVAVLGSFALNAVMNLDPTRTTTLRNQFAADLTRRFREVRQAITESIIKNDCFGLSTERPVGLVAIPRKQFAFKTSTDKVSGFMSWLETEVDRKVLEVHYAEAGRTVAGHSGWMNTYIKRGYKRGIGRAEEELRKQTTLTKGAYLAPDSPLSAIDAAFNQPIHADRVGLLYTRTFNELKGITEAMDQQVSRVLAEGMAEGLGPMKIARNINNRVDKIGITRARTLARTEIIRAHHVATINTYREAHVEGVRVKAEWSTAGDNRVCSECEDMEGRVFTLDQIEGMIPLHPSCRCCAIPAGVGEVRKGQELLPEVELETLPSEALPKGVRLPPSRVIKAKPKPAPKSVSKKKGYRSKDVEDYEWTREQEGLVKDLVKSGCPDADEALQSVADYTHGWSDSANRALRKGKIPDNVNIKALDNYLKYHKKVSDDKVLYRGVEKYKGMDLRKLKPGQIIRDKGYSSTSTGQRIAADFAQDPGSVMMRIQGPGRVGVRLPRAVNEFAREEEVLLPRGLRLKVISVERNVVIPNARHKMTFIKLKVVK